MISFRKSRIRAKDNQTSEMARKGPSRHTLIKQQITTRQTPQTNHLLGLVCTRYYVFIILLIEEPAAEEAQFNKQWDLNLY